MKLRMVSGMAACLVLGGMACSTAFAHDKMMKDGMMTDDMMMKMDANHDGMVSSAEHAAHAKMMFDTMDTNHDGMMSKAEMDAGMKMMHDKHMMKKDGMMKDDSMMKDDMPAKK